MNDKLKELKAKLDAAFADATVFADEARAAVYKYNLDDPRVSSARTYASLAYASYTAADDAYKAYRNELAKQENKEGES